MCARTPEPVKTDRVLCATSEERRLVGVRGGEGPLLLNLVDQEEASVEEAFDAVCEAGGFRTREACRGRARYAPWTHTAAVLSGDKRNEGCRAHTHLSQHMLVKDWMEVLRRCCACSFSIKVESSFCVGVGVCVCEVRTVTRNGWATTRTFVASSNWSMAVGIAVGSERRGRSSLGDRGNEGSDLRS